MQRLDLLTAAASRSRSPTSHGVRGRLHTHPGLAFYGQYATGVDPVGGLITLTEANAQFRSRNGRQIEIGVKQSFWGGRAR